MVVASIVTVVVLLIIFAVVLANSSAPSLPSGGSSSVDITGLNVRSADNACGLNGDNSGTIYLHPSGGGLPFIVWGLPGPGGSIPCTVQNVSTDTLGFVLFGSLPYTATSFPSTLAISMIVPSSFHGVLNVTFT